MKKVNWQAVIENAEILHPAFEKYVKKRGYAICPAKEQIKLWYEFLEWLEEYEKKMRNVRSTTRRTP